jgi:hypothetical protein
VRLTLGDDQVEQGGDAGTHQPGERRNAGKPGTSARTMAISAAGMNAATARKFTPRL